MTIKIYIAGENVEFLNGSLELEDAINERSTATFIVRDPSGNKTYTKGQPVMIVDGIRARFGGIVENVTVQVIKPDNYRLHTIDCIDWHYLADKRIIAEAYQNENPGVIVKHIIDKYLVDEGLKYVEGSTDEELFLHPEFVATMDIDSSVDDFEVLEEVIFNYIPASRAFDALSEQTGAWWRIEPNRNLYFVKREHFLHPDPITGREMLNRGISVKEGNPLYRNRQWVRGGRDITDEQIEIKKGDGESRDFAVGFRIAKVPKVEVNLNGAGYIEESVLIKGLESQRKGVCDVDGTTVIRTDGSVFTPIMEGKVIVIDGSRYTVDTVTDNDNLILTASAGTGSDLEFKFPVWFWEKYSETITQEREDDALTADDLLKITYQGVIDIIIRTEDRFEIEARQAIEEIGTGYVEHVFDNPNIESRLAAFEIGAKKLQKYATGGRTLQFTTRRSNIVPGHLITVDLPEYNLNNAEMLVESVRAYNPKNTNIILYDIEAVEGPTHGSWQKFFANLALKGETYIVRENISESAVLVVLIPFTKSWQEADSPNIFLELYPDDVEPLYSNTHGLSFKPEDRTKYLAWYDESENELGRKVITQQTGAEEGSDILETMTYLTALEANHQMIKYFGWVGGWQATADTGTGIIVDRQEHPDGVTEKLSIEAWQIEKTDNKWV